MFLDSPNSWVPSIVETAQAFLHVCMSMCECLQAYVCVCVCMVLWMVWILMIMSDCQGKTVMDILLSSFIIIIITLVNKI
jgi:hypothetical protein